MKKMRILLFVLMMAGLIAAGTGCESKSLTFGGIDCPVDSQTLDLSGMTLTPQEVENLGQLKKLKNLDLRNTGLTVAQYEQVTAMLPDCTILWQIPVQGQYLDPDAKNLTITSLAEEDLAVLKYLSGPEQIHAEDCEELELLLQIQEIFPDCKIHYRVTVGGERILWNVTELQVEDADAAELMAQLKYLPNLTQVTLTGDTPDNERIWELKQAYPGIRFIWEFEFFGKMVSSETQELDLSGIPMESVAEVENGLKYFNDLQKVEMCDCGISSEEMDALWKRHPETRFIWAITVGNMHLRTDITTLMPHQFGYGTRLPPLRSVDCTEFKYLVDMVCLDLGHMFVGDISFVSYMPNLEFLLVCENDLTDVSPVAGLQKLKYLEVFYNRKLADISALAECPALEDINLSKCPIDDLSPLLELKNVKNLWLYEPYVSEEMEQKLAKAFPDARIVIHNTSAIGNGWRTIPNYFAQRDLLGLHYMK